MEAHTTLRREPRNVCRFVSQLHNLNLGKPLQARNYPVILGRFLAKLTTKIGAGSCSIFPSASGASFARSPGLILVGKANILALQSCNVFGRPPPGFLPHKRLSVINASSQEQRSALLLVAMKKREPPMWRFCNYTRDSQFLWPCFLTLSATNATNSAGSLVLLSSRRGCDGGAGLDVTEVSLLRVDLLFPKDCLRVHRSCCQFETSQQLVEAHAKRLRQCSMSRGCQF